MEYLIRDINSIDDTEYAKAAARFSDERINRLSEEDKKRTLTGRILLCELILRLYGKTDFDVKAGKNGKPELDFCFFNISHSGKYAVCAVSDVPVGIDIEKMTDFKRRERYMLFSKEESDYVNETEEAERFYTLWTMKEAYIKAVGGTLGDAGRVTLVRDGRLCAEFKGYLFKTEYRGGYALTVCEKARCRY